MTYGEKVDATKLDVKELGKAAPLLQGLRSIQPNMAFAPLFMKQCLLAVASSRAAAWKFGPDDCEEFATDVGGRVRTMCRHVMKAYRKKPQPRWLERILGSSGSAQGEEPPEAGEEDEEGEEEVPAAHDPVTMPHGAADFDVRWDGELQAGGSSFPHPSSRLIFLPDGFSTPQCSIAESTPFFLANITCSECIRNNF